MLLYVYSKGDNMNTSKKIELTVNFKRTLTESDQNTAVVERIKNMDRQTKLDILVRMQEMMDEIKKEVK